MHTNALKRELICVVATDEVDAYKTVIDPRGLDLRAYEKNPVVHWDRGKDKIRGAMPIARAMKTWIDEVDGVTRLLALVKFSRDTFAMSIFDMHAEGKLRTWDTSILPADGSFGPPTSEELRVRPSLKGCKALCRSGELLSISAVPYSPGRGTETLSVERSLREQVEDDHEGVFTSFLAELREALARDDAELREAEEPWLRTGGCRNVRCF